MKILALSNPPWAPSGYGRQAAAFIRQMAHLGHEVAIVANHGLASGIQDWNGTKVFPKLAAGGTGYGSESLGKWAAYTEPDLVMTFMDSWVTTPQMFADYPWVPHFPIDVAPTPRPITDPLKSALLPLVYSKWGTEAAREQGVSYARYVPLTVDTRVFKPGDKAAAREALRWPQDKFIVGMVAANVNQLSRKCLPQNIEGFARFHRKHPDSMLYLHTDILGRMADGIPLKGLIDHLGIGERVMVPNPLSYEVGMDMDRLATIYQAMDVLLASTATEGFGLPILEAEACGTPAITGDWSSMSELTFNPSQSIPVERSEPWWFCLGGYWHIPHIDAIEEAITFFYDNPAPEQDRLYMASAAASFDDLAVAEKFWRPIMREIRDMLGMRKRLMRPSVADEVAEAMLRR